MPGGWAALERFRRDCLPLLALADGPTVTQPPEEWLAPFQSQPIAEAYTALTQLITTLLQLGAERAAWLLSDSEVAAGLADFLCYCPSFSEGADFLANTGIQALSDKYFSPRGSSSGQDGALPGAAADDVGAAAAEEAMAAWCAVHWLLAGWVAAISLVLAIEPETWEGQALRNAQGTCTTILALAPGFWPVVEKQPLFGMLRRRRPPQWAEELALWAVSGMESFCQQAAASTAPGGQDGSEASELWQPQHLEHLSSLLRVFVTCYLRWMVLGGAAAETGSWLLDITRLDALACIAQQGLHLWQQGPVERAPETWVHLYCCALVVRHVYLLESMPTSLAIAVNELAWLAERGLGTHLPLIMGKVVEGALPPWLATSVSQAVVPVISDLVVSLDVAFSCARQAEADANGHPSEAEASLASPPAKEFHLGLLDAGVDVWAGMQLAASLLYSIAAWTQAQNVRMMPGSAAHALAVKLPHLPQLNFGASLCAAAVGVALILQEVQRSSPSPSQLDYLQKVSVAGQRALAYERRKGSSWVGDARALAELVAEAADTQKALTAAIETEAAGAGREAQAAREREKRAAKKRAQREAKRAQQAGAAGCSGEAAGSSSQAAEGEHAAAAQQGGAQEEGGRGEVAASEQQRPQPMVPAAAEEATQPGWQQQQQLYGQAGDERQRQLAEEHMQQLLREEEEAAAAAAAQTAKRAAKRKAKKQQQRRQQPAAASDEQQQQQQQGSSGHDSGQDASYPAALPASEAASGAQGGGEAGSSSSESQAGSSSGPAPLDDWDAAPLEHWDSLHPGEAAGDAGLSAEAASSDASQRPAAGGPASPPAQQQHGAVEGREQNFAPGLDGSLEGASEDNAALVLPWLFPQPAQQQQQELGAAMAVGGQSMGTAMPTPAAAAQVHRRATAPAATAAAVAAALRPREQGQPAAAPQLQQLLPGGLARPLPIPSLPPPQSRAASAWQVSSQPPPAAPAQEQQWPALSRPPQAQPPQRLHPPQQPHLHGQHSSSYSSSSRALGAPPGCGGPAVSALAPASKAPAVSAVVPDSKERKDLECVLCLDELPDCVLLPCRHLAMCTPCAREMWAGQQLAAEPMLCPVCRAQVEHLFPVFLP